MRCFMAILSFFLCCLPAFAQGKAEKSDSEPRKILHVVATAHLDTQWRWTIQDTINKCIPDTLFNNFRLFEKYPGYVFSFEGSFRYALMKEYYPEAYQKLKEYVKAGRWYPVGSSVDSGDANAVSPESLIRHIVYGNGYFKREFGKESRDIFLPDCFGFGWALASVAAHCGLLGFSTQKLVWGSCVGIPFPIGFWEGVDGTGVVAVLNPGSYGSMIRQDLSRDKTWQARINDNGEKYGLFSEYSYFGTGDVGGAPDEESVKWLEESLHSDGPTKVVSSAADQLYRELTPEQIARLPRWKDELLMTRHGVGCYTSQAYMKRLNRHNELLADAAERAASAATWLGGVVYPYEKLTESWQRFLWHQFHDDLTGTSIPEAYLFSWNDEVIALNQFAAVLQDAVGTIAGALDTRVKGIPLLVYNPLSIPREDIVEAHVVFAPGQVPEYVKVFTAAGKEVPSQVKSRDEAGVAVVFLADVASLSWTVFDVRPADAPCQIATGLKASQSVLENNRYRVTVNENGDVSGVLDKEVGCELLCAPLRLQLLRDMPKQWPAWEITYEDISAPVTRFVSGPAHIQVVETGPARLTLEISRGTEGSLFKQRLHLAAGGAGNRIEVDTWIDWKTRASLLKAVFPLAASNEKAVYDLGLGTIARGNNTAQKYEVPAQQWADVTDRSGHYGVAVLNDCKYGWDKPDDHTLRLSLVRTPGSGGFPDQYTMDIGHHNMLYAIMGHRGDHMTGQVSWEAARINQKLLAFQTTVHEGRLGQAFSLLKISTPLVAVRALKKAEASDEIVLRLQELSGKPVENVTVEMAGDIVSAREMNGMEEALPDHPVTIRDGKIVLDMLGYRPRTLALRLAPSSVRLSVPQAQVVSIPYNLDVVSCDKEDHGGDVDGQGHAIPAELFPETVVAESIPFRFGPKATAKNNALVCQGQQIRLPVGNYNRIYLLAHAVGGDTPATFKLGERRVVRTIQDGSAHIGQWDSRVIDGKYSPDIRNIVPGYIKRDPIGWLATHRHDRQGNNEAYVFTYVFKYCLDSCASEEVLTLPEDERIRVFAITVVRNEHEDTQPAQYLYDHLSALSVSPQPLPGLFMDAVTVHLRASERDAKIRYTLDGSDPNETSALYTAPLVLTESTTIRARAYKPGFSSESCYLREATYVKVIPREADQAPQLLPGLHYRYYEGRWDKLPNFDELAPRQEGTTQNFGVEPRLREDWYALKFNGYLHIQEDGIYHFYTISDDGSKLFIGEQEIVNNDGLHGALEQEGAVALKRGFHRITVTFFEGPVDERLDVFYEGPGVVKQRIPTSVLFREKEMADNHE